MCEARSDERHRPAASRSTARVGLTLALAAGLLATAAPAAKREAKTIAASMGVFGLEVTTGIACMTADLVVPAGPVTTDQISCATIRTATPGPVNVATPGSVFETGSEIGLDNGFLVEPDTPFVALLNPFVDSQFAFVGDPSPEATGSYIAWFSLDLDPLTLADGEDLGIFVGYNAAQVEQFRVIIRRNAAMAENRLVIQGRDDSVGLVEHGVEFPLIAGFNRIAISWRADGGRGQLLASVNNSLLAGLDSLSNAAGRIDFVRLGLVDGNPSTTTGSYYLDDFASFRTLAP